MKKLIMGFLLFIFSMNLCLIMPLSEVWAEAVSNDSSVEELSSIESSVSLVSGAWEALNNDNLKSVLNLTNECIRRYGPRAQQMQEELSEYPTGTESKIRFYWALNDVATALFIQGKALENAGGYKEAGNVYKTLIDQYTFGQCWDPKGWFWKPAEVARENLAMIETGIFYDFGNYTSAELVKKAWEALEKEDINLVIGYTDKCIRLYGDRAHEMQAQLDHYPEGDYDELLDYWALNDVATAHFIKGRAYMIEGNEGEVFREFKIIRDELSYGQCWDPRGWWWSLSSEANKWLELYHSRGQDRNKHLKNI